MQEAPIADDTLGYLLPKIAKLNMLISKSMLLRLHKLLSELWHNLTVWMLEAYQRAKHHAVGTAVFAYMLLT